MLTGSANACGSSVRVSSSGKARSTNTTEHLTKASAARREAADAAQRLEDLSRGIAKQLDTASTQAASAGHIVQGLEGRMATLGNVEKRMGRFEELLATWEAAQTEAAQALEQITNRQAMIDAVQAQIKHASEIAERTAEHVQSIASSRQQIEEARATLETTRAELVTANGTMRDLADRRRQLDELEARLARADALGQSVRSTVEVLAGQRAFVDQILERTGTLSFPMKQAEALTEALRTECALATQLKAAVDELRREV